MTGHVGCAFRPGAASSGKYCTVQRCLATSLHFGVARQSRRNAHTNADVNRARRHSQSGATRATGGQASAAKAATTDFKVVIAGAGIGGLVLAVALLKKGVDVLLIERDLTAIRGEGKYRGPIQIQSNALAALEAIDAKMGAEVLSAGCVTGDRVNGLCDGVSGDWYVKFDTFHPAADKGLPVTRVVNRYTLQNILMKRAIELAGEGVIRNGCTVVGYEERKDSQGRLQVEALLDSGERVTGNMLVGADGIRSKVREQMVGKQEAHYSEYTCYTGISNFTPHDIDTVGYRVFLGNGQYFVSSDVGDGKMQWYGFHEEPAGGGDAPGKSKERLMEIFGDWCDDVVDLIQCTPEEDVLRRDIYDRPPIFTWTRGSVVLLGDSAHAMQPNLGQGGCMAIEDGYELSKLLADGLAVTGPGQSLNVKPILQQYQTRRLVRASAIHGMAGMAAIAASTYKAYLGEGLGPLSWIQQFQIPHPGRVAGQLVLKSSMPFVLDWVLGGNVGNLRQEDRAAYCSLSDAPRAFSESMFPAFMRDDDQLLLAMRADWLLLPLRRHQTARLLATDSVENCTYLSESNQATSSLTVGAGASCALRIQDAAVDSEHARLEKRSDGFHYAIDLGSSSGTWLNDKRLQPHVPTRLHPADTLAFGASPENAALRYKIKLRHETLRNAKSLFVSDHPDESFVGEAVGV